jgi:D-beta-D-heptose 7-phosphate kinase/D-beta-D-heptose 1-phosphate adenosyltransferase
MFLGCKKPNIIVFGDIMMDFTNKGLVHKLANEAPIPVFLRETESASLGGCGNVLQNLSSLGCNKLYLFSMCGDDGIAPILLNKLNELPVIHTVVQIPGKRTTSKHRFFSNNKLMFRYDDEEYYTLDKDYETKILESFEQILKEEVIDCILFSDYNKGFLTHNLCQSVITLANKHSIFTCVDPKNNYEKYRNCSLIKPNRNEVAQLFGIEFTLHSLEDVHRRVRELSGAKNTVITLGELGISGYFESDEYFYWKHESNDVIDVTGAGDVVNAILAYYFTQLKEKKNALMLASYLGTVSVSHLGAYTLQFNDILEAYKFLSKNKVVRLEDLKKIQKPILFTNGCFDILHEGHISLFEYCKEIAGNNYEVVLGLNSDTSISRLKGPSRPICNLRTRVSILNAIQHIDWIVVFDEDAPELLLKELQPAILVKGGDYIAESVIGKEYCKKLLLFPFAYKTSTTSIVKKIQLDKK